MRRLATFFQKAPWIIAFARIIWRFGQAKFSAGVVGVVIDDERRVLLVEHVFHPYAPWGLPGGWIDRGESPAEAVVREFREELMLTIQAEQILHVDLAYNNHLDLAYLCRAEGNVGQLSGELLDYAWVSLDELPRLQRFHYEAIQSAIHLKQVPREIT